MGVLNPMIDVLIRRPCDDTRSGELSYMGLKKIINTDALVNIMAQHF